MDFITDTACTIHPYLEVHEGKEEEFKTLAGELKLIVPVRHWRKEDK